MVSKANPELLPQPPLPPLLDPLWLLSPKVTVVEPVSIDADPASDVFPAASLAAPADSTRDTVTPMVELAVMGTCHVVPDPVMAPMLPLFTKRLLALTEGTLSENTSVAMTVVPTANHEGFTTPLTTPVTERFAGILTLTVG